jgi:predicted MFS family arabinose efflux permease
MSNLADDRDRFGLAPVVAVATASRIVLNTARRFAYPFAPALSRGLGVPLTAVTALIAMNQATAVLGALLGPAIDRVGYRTMILAGLALLAVGMFAAGFLPVYGTVMVGLFLAGLGKSVFDPAIQAYVSQRVPYRRRGTVIGILEISWSGATLAGIPLVGLLIDGAGWRAPFFTLGALAVAGMALLAVLMAPDPRSARLAPPSAQGVKALWQAWGRLGRNPSALSALGFAFFVSAANDNLFVVYGVWLEGAFGLTVVALGLSTAVIGLAELLGEGLTATVADRLGLRRSVTWGLTAVIVVFVLLPLTGSRLAAAGAGLFALFLCFEFTFVTSLSLATELVPVARATMMSAYFAAAGLGRVAGALLGGQVWKVGGILATGWVSAGLALLALVCLTRGVAGRKKPPACR